MKRKQSIVVASLGTAALVAAFTLAGSGAANAAPPTADSTPAPTTSCWIDADTLQSLCVPTGEDLVAAVLEQDGIAIQVPAGTVIGGVTISAARVSVSLLATSATSSDIATSVLYDDINYGGSSFVMTSSNGCYAGIANLVQFGWNDRASSFKSLNGCTTAVYQNINYGGTRVGFATNKATFGSQNDQASSWITEG